MKRIRSPKAIAVLLSIMLLTGCWDKVEIEERLFVLGIGVDDAGDGVQDASGDRFTLSFTSPVVSKVKGGGERAFNTYKTVDNSVIMSLSQLLLRFSKKQFFGHTRALFFGEEIMKDEKLLKEVTDGVSRYNELHNSMYVYIVPGRAEEVFRVNPFYDNVLIPYITGITENSDYTSEIIKLSLSDMIIMLTEQNGGLVIPRLIPGEREVSMKGAGVLKNYKLIGYLDDQETAAYNWLTDKARGGVISVEQDYSVVTFRHYTFRRDIVLSKVEGGKIYLDYKMKTEGGIEEYRLGDIVLDTAILRGIEKKVEKKIEKESTKLIKKFREEFRTDLIGAREYLSKYHPKLFKTIEKDYDRYFTDNIVINVTADVHIRRVGLIK